MILREYKRIGKYKDYIDTKKRIVEILENDKWSPLAALILKEDNEFVTENAETENTRTALDMQFEELSTSHESPVAKTEKLK